MSMKLKQILIFLLLSPLLFIWIVGDDQLFTEYSGAVLDFVIEPIGVALIAGISYKVSQIIAKKI